jgi:hypothetical protein
MIKRLAAFDMDGTLIDTPMPENGKLEWQKYYNKPFQYQGWWGRPESLDLNVFNIKAFPSVLNQLKKELVTPDTLVIVLTSRMEKLRPQVQAILDANNIHVHKLDMRKSEHDKGVKILRYLEELPDLKVINVYDDRDSDIESYKNIVNQIPEGVEFNVYLAESGKLSLVEAKNSLVEIILDEIKKII